MNFASLEASNRHILTLSDILLSSVQCESSMNTVETSLAQEQDKPHSHLSFTRSIHFPLEKILNLFEHLFPSQKRSKRISLFFFFCHTCKVIKRIHLGNTKQFTCLKLIKLFIDSIPFSLQRITIVAFFH